MKNNKKMIAKNGSPAHNDGDTGWISIATHLSRSKIGSQVVTNNDRNKAVLKKRNNNEERNQRK